VPQFFGALEKKKQPFFSISAFAVAFFRRNNLSFGEKATAFPENTN
jgi:hypothetical protein